MKEENNEVGNQAATDILKETLVIINGFVHDMATGIWIGALSLMYYGLDKAAQYNSDLVYIFALSLLKNTWYLSVVSLIVMLLTGAARAAAFRYYGWTGDIARGRKRLLFIKHVILGIMVAAGLVLQVKLFMRM